MSSQSALKPLAPARTCSRGSRVYDQVSSGIKKATTACRECQKRKTKVCVLQYIKKSSADDLQVSWWDTVRLLYRRKYKMYQKRRS